MTAHIVLATPCFGGVVHQTYMLSVCALQAKAAPDTFRLDLELAGGDALITRARSVLAAKFLDTPGATHLLFVDADIGFEPEHVLRLLQHDKDVVAAPYPLKGIDWQAVPSRVVAGEPLAGAGLDYVGTLVEPRVAEGDCLLARYVGTGFVLVRRRVFERLIAAHPELRFRAVHSQRGGVPASDNLYALFDPMIDAETGAYLSEDYAFCRRWRALGGDIWLDPAIRLSHVGLQTFAGDPAARFRAP